MSLVSLNAVKDNNIQRLAAVMGSEYLIQCMNIYALIYTRVSKDTPHALVGTGSSALKIITESKYRKLAIL